MKIENKEETNLQIRTPRLGKRDYYFHADEDFREDREWGKLNSVDLDTANTSTLVCAQSA